MRLAVMVSRLKKSSKVESHDWVLGGGCLFCQVAIVCVCVCACVCMCVYLQHGLTFTTRALHFITYFTYISQCILTTLQHIATHCNTLQYISNTLRHIATHRNTSQHIATHCNTLKHTATHCNTVQQKLQF